MCLDNLFDESRLDLILCEHHGWYPPTGVLASSTAQIRSFQIHKHVVRRDGCRPGVRVLHIEESILSGVQRLRTLPRIEVVAAVAFQGIQRILQHLS